MVPQDTAIPAKPFAHEIASYDNEELGGYLEANGRLVSVQDPENIPAGLIQRLKRIVRYPRRTAQSCSVDLDQVSTRLRLVAARTDRTSRSPTPATTEPSPPPEVRESEDRRVEIESYEALVNAGGRPPYPLRLLEGFLNNPEQYLEHEAYRDIILFWRGDVVDRDERTLFCTSNLSSWRCFRRLQGIIREQSVKSEWKLIQAAGWERWEAFLEHPASRGWEGGWDFNKYAKNMKQRLLKYGFTRSFQLNKDMSRQDKLTTWIEYLGYEYWFYDNEASFVERAQPQHDRAWQKLMDSNVLGPEETYEGICNIQTAFRDANEGERIEKAERSATAAVSSAAKAFIRHQGTSSENKSRKRLMAAQSRLDVVKERHRLIKTRNTAITAFLQRIQSYRNAKRKAERHVHLLRWIQQQISLIELEFRSSDSVDITRELKRKRSEEPEGAQLSQLCGHGFSNRQLYPVCTMATSHTDQPQTSGLCNHEMNGDELPPKRRRHGGRSLTQTHSTMLAASATSQDTREIVGGNAKGTDIPEVSNALLSGLGQDPKPLRRSARIAEKNEREPLRLRGRGRPYHMTGAKSKSRTTSVYRPTII